MNLALKKYNAIHSVNLEKDNEELSVTLSPKNNLNQDKKYIKSSLVDQDLIKITSESEQDTSLANTKVSFFTGEQRENEQKNEGNSQQFKKYDSANYYINLDEDNEELSFSLSPKNNLDQLNQNDIDNDYKLNSLKFSLSQKNNLDPLNKNDIEKDNLRSSKLKLKSKTTINKIEFKAHIPNPRSHIMKKILLPKKSPSSLNKIFNKEKNDSNLWQEEVFIEAFASSNTLNTANIYIDNHKNKGDQYIKPLIMKKEYIGIHLDKNYKDDNKNYFEYYMPQRLRKGKF